MRAAGIVVVLLAGCSGKAEKEKAGTGTGTGTGSADARVAARGPGIPTLDPAAPLPAVPVGLPPPTLEDWVTPENVELGALLFFDNRISKDGKASCASCHDPAQGWAGKEARSKTVGGKPNLRHTPALVNLAWVPELGWDGAFEALRPAVNAHWRGQLEITPAEGIDAITDIPYYQAQFARASEHEPEGNAAITALSAFVITRYQGDAPWDRYERGDRAGVPTEVEAGYLIFTGKAQCSNCHVPPLYSDGTFHALGIGSGDQGRGRVDAAAVGAFRTPTCAAPRSTRPTSTTAAPPRSRTPSIGTPAPRAPPR